MQSKPFDKSVSRRRAKPPLSKTLRHFLTKTSKQCCALCPLRKLQNNFENINLSDHINIVHKFLIQSAKC